MQLQIYAGQPLLRPKERYLIHDAYIPLKWTFNEELLVVAGYRVMTTDRKSLKAHEDSAGLLVFKRGEDSEDGTIFGGIGQKKIGTTISESSQIALLTDPESGKSDILVNGLNGEVKIFTEKIAGIFVENLDYDLD